VLFDTGYGNNTSFLAELEKKQLNYMGRLAKNRKVAVLTSKEIVREIRLDELARTLSPKDFSEVENSLSPSAVLLSIV
jgi:SRSO17 transposase